jgi:hypothetical protein
LAVARSYLEQDQLDLTAAPSFVKLELHDEERTAVRFDVTSHARAGQRARGHRAGRRARPAGALTTRQGSVALIEPAYHRRR